MTSRSLSLLETQQGPLPSGSHLDAAFVANRAYGHGFLWSQPHAVTPQIKEDPPGGFCKRWNLMNPWLTTLMGRPFNKPKFLATRITWVSMLTRVTLMHKAGVMVSRHSSRTLIRHPVPCVFSSFQLDEMIGSPYLQITITWPPPRSEDGHSWIQGRLGRALFSGGWGWKKYTQLIWLDSVCL